MFYFRIRLSILNDSNLQYFIIPRERDRDRDKRKELRINYYNVTSLFLKEEKKEEVIRRICWRITINTRVNQVQANNSILREYI